MPLSEPGWWYPEKGGDRPWQAKLLAPLAAVYAWAGNRRMLRDDGWRAPCAVICVGNFTSGGTGKTPLSCWIAQALAEAGKQVVFLSRGYGGNLSGPVRVDNDHHTARHVGDEPLLLARYAPVMIARDRARGAEAIADMFPDVDAIVMDDGLQNPSLIKDLTIAVVDGARGFGNGCVIPAGPLRTTLSVQAALTQIVIVNTGMNAYSTTTMSDTAVQALNDCGFRGQILQASVQVQDGQDEVRGQRVLAFAGIGSPERFFDTVKASGADVVATRVFKDHHVVTEPEAEQLLTQARDANLTLVTTEKDAVRLRAGGSFSLALLEQAKIIPITFAFSDDDKQKLIDALRRVV